jgi:drug/metabolite transporter (DMT)-like permease
MTKRANTVVFMLAATVLNVLLMVVIFGVLLILDLWLLAGRIDPNTNVYILIFCVFGTMALTFFLYHRIVKWATAKWDLEEKLEPLFGKKNQP